MRHEIDSSFGGLLRTCFGRLSGIGSLATPAGSAILAPSFRRQTLEVFEMLPTILIVVYCVMIAGVSFAGGLLPAWIKLTHTRLQILMSFVGGLILGVALLHMLPHALASYGNIDLLLGAMLFGVLAMFLLMRVFHIHHHDPLPESAQAEGVSGDHSHVGDAPGHEHGHDHSHEHGHSHDHAPTKANWIGLAIGFAVHTLMDGVALAASVQIAAHNHDHFELYGFGIFLAIFLHKPLDAMSIAWTAQAGGWSKKWMKVANLGFALMCPLGALAFYGGVSAESEQGSTILAVALAFSAGVFLCISLSDILPEVSFHSHDRVTLSVALLLGIVLAWTIGFLEPDHVHELHAPEVDHDSHMLE